MKIGKVIKQIRAERGLSQGDLATACDINQAYLSQIENGNKTPSGAMINNIAEQLKVPASVIYYLAIEENDVPENKRHAFNQLSSTIESLVKSVYL